MINKKIGLDLLGQKILTKINGGFTGTLELSEFIGMAPKNLLNRIKKYQDMGLIEVGKISQKPKGWKRHFNLSIKGKKYLKIVDDFQVKVDFINTK